MKSSVRAAILRDFATFLEKKIQFKPDEISKIYDVIRHSMGLYLREVNGIFSALSDKNITSIVEIGRCFGGGLYVFSCMFPNLKEVLSIDIDAGADAELRKYFDHFGIKHNIIISDSTSYVPEDKFWDFVFIDGDHTRESVSKDISIWKDKCRYIGFHDYADKGRQNAHKRYYPEVVEEIKKAMLDNGWEQIGNRGCSEIVFKVKNVHP